LHFPRLRRPFSAHSVATATTSFSCSEPAAHAKWRRLGKILAPIARWDAGYGLEGVADGLPTHQMTQPDPANMAPRSYQMFRKNPFARRPNLGEFKTRRARVTRPNLENLEGRALLTSLIANSNGVTEAIGNLLVHYQDNGAWSNLNAPGTVASMVDSHNQYGQEELFVRLTSGEIWDYVYATNKWYDTGEHLDLMVANANGVTGTYSGVLTHYQDNGTWINMHTPGIVTAFVDSHSPSGQEELFANVLSGATVSTYTYIYATGKWNNTGLLISNLVANANGVTGTIGSAIVHYQDNGNRLYNLAAPFSASDVQMVDSHDPQGREELFVRANTGAVWDFVYATGHWHEANVQLSNLTANVDGVMGTSGGTLLHYQDIAGPSSLGINGVAAVVDSRAPNGREEVFVISTTGSLWEQSNGWHNLGIPSTGGGSGIVPGGAGDPNFRLHSAYQGSLQDHVENNGQRFYSQGSIYIGINRVTRTSIGYQVTGTLTLKDYAGVAIQVPFEGTYLDENSTETLVIENLNVSPGSAVQGVQFQFNFEVTASGTLYANDSQVYSFNIYDTVHGNYDDVAYGDPNSYASLSPGS
jgi:hypothetical protein